MGAKSLLSRQKQKDISHLVSLREFNLATDYQDVYALWENAGPGIHVGRSDQPEEIAKKVQRDPDLFLIAELNGEIIGTVMGGFDGRRGMMYHLAVAEEYRRKGIGLLLMNELEKRLRLKGCLRYYLLVTTDNQQAIHFYEAHGWQQMPLLIYAKDLD